MILKDLQKDFKPAFHIVSCLCEINNKILLLRRHQNKPQGNYWGVPAGKVNNNETLEAAMIRELKEETGIAIIKQDIKYITKVYVRYNEYDFIYSMFKCRLTKHHHITLNENEHTAFKWITPNEALTMDLIQDEGECIRLVYNL